MHRRKFLQRASLACASAAGVVSSSFGLLAQDTAAALGAEDYFWPFGGFLHKDFSPKESQVDRVAENLGSSKLPEALKNLLKASGNLTGHRTCINR